MASIIRTMSKPLPPSRTAPQFVVRFPNEDLRDRIAEVAKANNRSMNAEIVARLDESFENGSNVLLDAFEAELAQKTFKILSLQSSLRTSAHLALALHHYIEEGEKLSEELSAKVQKLVSGWCEEAGPQSDPFMDLEKAVKDSHARVTEIARKIAEGAFDEETLLTGLLKMHRDGDLVDDADESS